MDTPDPRKREVALLFPRLNDSEFDVRSDATDEYNCIAWAAGVNNDWLDPTLGCSWPDSLPRNYVTKTFLMLYQKLGYVLCEDGRLEKGYEKVALYERNGLCKHAARQLPNGLWTSKLGKLFDIEHQRLDGLIGKDYGVIVHFLKRPRAK